MRKIEKKQVPQFAVLAAITVAGLGYTAYQLWSGSNPPRAATAAIPAAGAPTGSPSYGPGPGAAPVAAAAGTAGPAKDLARLTTLPPSFTADPFRPALRPPETSKPGQPPRAAPPSAQSASALPPTPETVNLNAPPLPPSGEWTPRALAGQFPRTEETLPDERAPGAPSQPAPAPLQRPAITLTGVIEGEPSVAILRGAQDERQVVRVNDRVAGRYVVKQISADGIVLAAAGGTRPDRWFLPLGADAKGKG